jgi:hypothetical protein
VCKSETEWNTTAVAACGERDMALQSFAILQPCGVDMFTGVEFVCCPKVAKPVEVIVPTTEKQPAAAPSIIKIELEKNPDQPLPVAQTESAQPATQKQKQEDQEDFFTHYLQKSYDDRYMNEHQYFEKAKSDLQKHHHERVTKMMKEWASARHRVQDMNDVDPKGADKLNREITARFQKTYEAMEQEGQAEKRQLVALHQQRVQAELNDKKRHAMEHYMEVLTDPRADATNILKALKHYVKTEQKDRMHTVNHYKHLLDTVPADATSVRQQTLDHLHIIDQRIQQAVDMLNRVPEYEQKVRMQIDDFMKQFHEIDVAINDILTAKVDIPKPELFKNELFTSKASTPAPNPRCEMPFAQTGSCRAAFAMWSFNPTSGKCEEFTWGGCENEDGNMFENLSDCENTCPTGEPKVVEKHAPELIEDKAMDEDDEDYYDDEYEDEEEYEYDEDDEDDDEDESDESYEQEEYESVQTPVAVAKEPTEQVAAATELKPTQFDDEVDEDESVLPVAVKRPAAAHIVANKLEVHEMQSKDARAKAVKSLYNGYMFGVAVAAIAVFVILVTGIVVLRRKNARAMNAANHGFVEVDQAASPEERHVANMQMNGYENPTYKYFEMNTSNP